MTDGSLLRLDDLMPFFERVGRSQDRALLLDYDGTIAPFAAHRSLAEPYAGMRSVLRGIALAPKLMGARYGISSEL